jgi:hypothetical protein
VNFWTKRKRFEVERGSIGPERQSGYGHIVTQRYESGRTYMAEEKFETNLFRLIAAEVYFSLGLQVSREMFGKSYFSLGNGEKAAVDQAVLAAVAGNYQVLTPEFLKAQAAKAIPGFQAQSQVETPSQGTTEKR